MVILTISEWFMPTLENIVDDLLNRLHIEHKKGYPVRTKYGTWKVDFYIDSTPPIVLSCKALGERGLQASERGGTAKAMACIAFTEFYELKYNSTFPNDTCLILVYGDLPLKTRQHNFPELFSKSLGVHLFSISEKEALSRFILKCAPSLMSMAYLKMAGEVKEETQKAILPQSKSFKDFAESGALIYEILKKLAKEYDDLISTASPSELEKIIDNWLKARAL
jgi:hypothetical protein